MTTAVLAPIGAPEQPDDDTPPGGPPNATDHGVNASVFPKLWAGDQDDGIRVNTTAAPTPDAPVAIRQLASVTDIPFDEPPRAVERWNRGDQVEFPATNGSVSYYPSGVNRTNGTIIRDAYVELFAVHPSTKARLTPDEQPLYVPPSGTVLATVDYRVVEETRTGRGSVASRSHRIAAVRLLIDNQTVAVRNGSHTPRLTFTDLSNHSGTTHTLTVEAEIVVGHDASTAACRSGQCPAENVTTNQSTAVDRVVVRDSVTVTEYKLTVSGFRGRYPNGDVGVMLYKNRPWLGYTFGGGTVRGVWRFYSARDPDWDILTRSTSEGTEQVRSDAQPLQVYAYPIETGPTPKPRGRVRILRTLGTDVQPPTVPSTVRLDVLTESYTASYGLATRIDPTAFNRSALTAQGIVRGVTTQPGSDHLTTSPIHRSNLTLTVENRTDETVTVQVTLQDANTTRPINTSTREGSIVLAGRTVNTSADGTVSVTLPRQGGALSARFEPGPWWRHRPGFIGDSTTVYVRGTPIHYLHVLYQLAVPISMLLLGAFLIDRFTGWALWPPWRWL